MSVYAPKNLFYITLQDTRSHNLYLEAKTKDILLTFLKAVTDAKIKSIKKVVYSKKYQINTDRVGAFAPAPSDLELRILCKSKSHTNTIIIDFPKKNITRKEVEQMLIGKMYILDEPIEKILTVLVQEDRSNAKT